MPWQAFKVDNEFCVFRIDAQSKRFGKSLGCHPTRKKANGQVAALNIAEPQKDTVFPLPRNKRGFTVPETFIIVRQVGKFGKEGTNYVNPAPIPEIVCGTCRFFLREEDSEIGRCQVVSGPIKWSATSDLYINATQESQASFQGLNAYAEEYRDKEEMTEIKADIRTPKKTPLGTFLRAKRIGKNWSTSDLEKKMTIDESTIAKIETGVISVPSRQILNQFAKALGVPIKTLLGKLPKDRQPAANIAPGGRPVGKEQDKNVELLEIIIDEERFPVIGEPDTEEKQMGFTTGGFEMSFEEIDANEEAAEKAREARNIADAVPRLLRNIMGGASVEDRAGLVAKLTDGLKTRMNKIMGKSSHLDEEENSEHEAKETEIKETSSFMVFKDEVTGEYKFVSSYSNNIRDDDNPPEIISAKSHERFEDLIDKGQVPLPEVWLWHIPDWHIGQTDVITYDKENGVAIAAGHFFPEANDIAEAIYQNQEHWGVSHGMPSESIVRNEKDRTIIEQHITKEISPLPGYAAANKWADFTILKEKTMTVSQEKKDKLEKFGVKNDMLAGIELRNQEVSKAADDLGLERKEETLVEETPVKKDEKKENPTEEKTSSAFSKEQAGELAEVFKVLSENITESVTKSVLDQVKEVLIPIAEKLDADEKSIEDEIKERLHQTPPSSLAAMVFGQDVFKSATNAPETKVDGRTKEGKDKPAETNDDEFVMNSGDPFANHLITRIVNDTTTKELEEAAKAA